MTGSNTTDKGKLREKLFDALDGERVGMLGITGTSDHMQPMTHYLDREKGCLWFISSNRTDLVGHIATGARSAHFTVSSGNGQVYACMSGPLSISFDDAKLEELWSPMASSSEALASP
jgi:general stress protein 26